MPDVQRLVLWVGAGLPIREDIATASDIPWTWARLAGYVQWVRSVAERAAMDENPREAFPPRHILWDPQKVEEWFRARQKGREP